MMFFKRRRDQRAPVALDGHGVRPTSPRPGPAKSQLVRSFEVGRMTEQRIHALETRIKELESDVAEGLDAVLCVASYALGACQGTGRSLNFDAVKVCDKAGRLGEIVHRLKAMQS
ncbi:hypothetical protein C0V97_01005 [Asaia sp. W19]|uniref:hypothetical protein n=1 Tax=unclassified Asaia TaxID=2685023 RepID=UPI000F8E2C07|nr:hypothetical protein [Asaia sp. W19]RUT27378.1 hypothetical protein C0V97_01005 [Asaia sp. W19]